MIGEIEVLQQADFTLSKCGRPIPPQPGIGALDIPMHFYYQAVVADESTQQQYREITGQHTFYMRAISGLPPAESGLYIQIKFPNGQFLNQALRDMGQFSGFGSNRYNLDREVECPPGSKIWITADTTIAATGQAQAFSLLFEGVYRIWMRNLQPQSHPNEFAASMPRVFRSRNQNIMAPRWATSDYPGDGLSFVYQTSTENPPVFALPAAGAGLQPTIKIPTDTGWEFLVQRVIITYVVDDGSSGTVYARIRESSGYQLTDDYSDVSKLSGQALPCWWRIGPGRDILIDLLVVDAAGTGNITYYCFFQGIRRRVA